MNIWKIVTNLPKIISFFNTLKDLIYKIIQGKKMPECPETMVLLESVKKLLDSGVIDIPGVDEAELSKAISEMEAQWTCKI